MQHETTDEHIEATLQEIKYIVKKLKNARSYGPGGITQKLIKYGSEKLLRMIQQMFEIVINGDKLTTERTEIYITSIFKKGERRKCENYRDISVIATNRICAD